MSQEYAVTWVGDPREWESNRGDRFLAYEIEVAGTAGKIEWSRKPDSDPPAVGQNTPLATIENGSHGKKLKVDWDGIKQAKAAGTSSASGAGPSNFGTQGSEYMKPRRPEETRKIERQHSQEMAIRSLTAMGTFDGKSAGLIHQTLKSWIDWFDADLGGQGSTQAPDGGSNKADALGPDSSVAPASSPADLSEFEQALQGAGLDTAAATAVALYMVMKLEPKRCDEAFRKLTDASNPSAQASALAALETLTEKDLGAPLPKDPEIDDDIPF